MKQYAVFQGGAYYPRPGWLDLTAAFETEDEALEYVEEQSGENDWWQIVDLTTGKIVRDGQYDDLSG